MSRHLTSTAKLEMSAHAEAGFWGFAVAVLAEAFLSLGMWWADEAALEDSASAAARKRDGGGPVESSPLLDGEGSAEAP